MWRNWREKIQNTHTFNRISDALVETSPYHSHRGDPIATLAVISCER